MSEAPGQTSNHDDTAEVVPFPFLDGTGELVEQERRRHERRHWGTHVSYPFVDSDGNVVTHNRRRVVDRRLGLKPKVVNPEAHPGPVLSLRFRDDHYHIDSTHAELRVGRHDEAELCIVRPHISRVHAHIVHRDGAFVLIDESSNGTSVRDASGKIHAVHRSELPLTGEGVIRFGQVVDDEADDLVFFLQKD